MAQTLGNDSGGAESIRRAIMESLWVRPQCQVCGDPVKDCGDYWADMCERHDAAAERINGDGLRLMLEGLPADST
jgi:hypothetical protein